MLLLLFLSIMIIIIGFTCPPSIRFKLTKCNKCYYIVRKVLQSATVGADLGGGCRGCAPPPPEMTCGFLISTVQSASQLYKICFIIWYVFSAVHIMLLPSRKPSSSYSPLKFVYVTSQLRHSLEVHPLLRKILDPPLDRYTKCDNYYKVRQKRPEVRCSCEREVEVKFCISSTSLVSAVNHMAARTFREKRKSTTTKKTSISSR